MSRAGVDAHDERIDLFAAAAHEESGPFDQLEQLDAFAFEEEHELGRRQNSRCTPNRAQRFKTSEREQVRVARTEPDDADHAGSFNRRDAVYFVAAGDAAADAAVRQRSRRRCRRQRRAGKVGEARIAHADRGFATQLLQERLNLLLFGLLEQRLTNLRFAAADRRFDGRLLFFDLNDVIAERTLHRMR